MVSTPATPGVAVRAGRALVTGGSIAAGVVALHTAVNLRLLRSPAADPSPCRERVSILIPARDEESHIEATVLSALAQEGLADFEVLVLDDGSRDSTGDLVSAIAELDPRVRLLTGGDDPLPSGWLGKPWACSRLAENATGDVLVFVDADVLLAPHAVAALIATMRDNHLALVAPYPRQQSVTWLERLVQPLVTWSWAATMPVRWAETSLRTSLSAANGQLIAVDAEAYRAAGGHGAVRGDVLEDIALMRAIKRSGQHAATVDGSQLATCRMYDSPSAVVDGYAKSLWAAFDGPVGSVAVLSLLTAAYVVPAVAAVAAPSARTRAIGVAGYAAGVTSRAMVARRTNERVLPDTLAQPASIVAFVALSAISWARHRRGTNTWKGRAVVPDRVSA